MSKQYLANDCLPFNYIDKGNEIPVKNGDSGFDTAVKKLCTFWYTTNSPDDDSYIAVLKTSYCENAPSPLTQWWAGRYIGQAYINNIEISIRPRFGESFLLAIIEDLYGIRVVNQNANDNQSPEWFSSLLKILRRRMWVEKCSNANRYGLPRKNLKKHYQGATFRGSLDVRCTIMPWLMKKEVCTYTYEKSLDEHICRIVYEAHRILSRDVITNTFDKRRKKEKQPQKSMGFSMPPTVQDTINTLNSQYKGSAFDLTENDYQRIRYNSIYLSWKPLVDFSWSIIRNRQLSYRASENQMDCVFVDMAEIWEAFLRKKLGEGLAEEGWYVWSAEKCRDTIYKGMFYQRDIIPDIILQRGDDFIVFDAKYKRMRGIKANVRNSDVDRSDLFQIHTYIQFVQHHLGNVVLGGLLYPISRKGYNDDGTPYEYSESEIIDTRSYHADNLFGVAGRGKSPHIPFIVDGIYCSETEDKDSMGKNVDAMIARIRNILNKQH